MLRRISRRRFAVAVLAAALGAAGAGSALAAEPAKTVGPWRLLFVGNSLTAANDLPATVAALSRAAGDVPPLETGAVVFGGYSLDDHLASGAALRRLGSERWNFVVLQQGPSSLPESRELLVAATRRFDPEIRAAGARPALYAVWPEKARSYAFPDVAGSYRAAAEAVGGVYLPAGEAWQAAWRRDPALPLYDRDDFHPSRLGSYLAALVVYCGITGRAPAGLSARVDPAVLPHELLEAPDRAALVEAAAQEALAAAVVALR